MGYGSSEGNMLVSTAGSNYLDGRGGADNLTGGGGRDKFVFRAGETDGDVIMDFNGNAPGLGDLMEFQGYGKGATFQQLSAIKWLISSADSSISGCSTRQVSTRATSLPTYANEGFRQHDAPACD